MRDYRMREYNSEPVRRPRDRRTNAEIERDAVVAVYIVAIFLFIMLVWFYPR